MRRALAVLVTVALVVLGALVAPAAGVGSRDAYPAGATGHRAAVEWRTEAYGPVPNAAGRAAGASQVYRRTLFHVFVRAGERLQLGSSQVGTGESDIVVWAPGVVTDTTPPADVPAKPRALSCRTSQPGAGLIANRAQEKAGPGAGGWTPCMFTAATTGIHTVAFTGAAGLAASGDTGGGYGSPDAVLDPTGDFQKLWSAVQAWELRVVPAASTTPIPGRVFTYVLAGFTAGNNRPVSTTMWLTTLDGYRYRVETNGFDPNGFVFYGNSRGFLDAAGEQLNKNIVGTGSTQQLVATTVGGTQLAAPQYPLSWDRLGPETLEALAIDAPLAPTVEAVEFIGHTGGTTYTSRGGRFDVTLGAPGTVEIVVSRDGSFDPGLARNATVRTTVGPDGFEPGSVVSLTWDGTDNSGAAMPARLDYPVRVQVRGGEYHAPMLDVEASVNGGPSIVLENPPAVGGVVRCPFTGADPQTTACSQAFYDDRGYVTNGVSVGTLDKALCTDASGNARFSGSSPSILFADPVSGFDSRSTQRGFGADATSLNANAACNGTAGNPNTLGDARGLDLWTYFPSQTVTADLDIIPLPTAPTADDDAYATDAGTTLTVPAAQGVLVGDTGTSLTAEVATDPARGTLTLGSDGGLTYVPQEGWSGPVTFTYRAVDAAGQHATATVTITVRPAGADDTASVAAGGVLTVTAANGVLSDDVGTGLTVVSRTSPSHGTLQTPVAADGSYRYTPAAGFSGTDSFTYTARDSSNQSYTRTVTITVTPLAADDSGSTSVDTVLTVTALDGVLANDVGSLEVESHTQPDHGSVEVEDDGSWVYTPPEGWSGRTTFTYTAGDGTSSVTRTVTVTVTPTALDDSATTEVDEEITGDVLGNDVGSLTRTGGTQPAHGSVTWDGAEFTYTPDAGWSGRDSFTYTVTDGTTTLTRTVRVLVTPTGADDEGSTPVDTVLTVAAADGVLANDVGSLEVESHTQPDHGSVEVEDDGSWVYTPPEGWSGRTTFTYTAGDGTSSVTRTVTVTVTPTALDDSATTEVDEEITGDVLGNDVGSLTRTGGTQPAHGSVTWDGAEFTYTPDAGWSGRDSFTYTVTDGTTTLTRTVRVLVTPTGADDEGSTPVDTVLTVAAADGVLANDVGSLEVESHTQPDHGSVEVEDDGSWVYTPPTGWSGTTSFSYTAGDGVSTVTQTVEVVVVPTAEDDSVSTAVDTEVSEDVLENDVGSLTRTGATQPAHGSVTWVGAVFTYTPPTGWSGRTTFTYDVSDGTTDLTRTVTVTVVPTAADDSATTPVGTAVSDDVLTNDVGSLARTAATAPSHGSVTWSGTTYTYTPSTGWSGRDSFTYTVSDGTTALTRTVSVLVTPTAADDAGTTPLDTVLTVTAADGLLGNDAGDLEVTGHTQPARGAVDVDDDGAWRYVPPAGWSGSTTFTYTAGDGVSTLTRTVTVTVTPTADDDSGAVAVGGTLTVPAASGLLANDRGTSLTVTGASTPGHGTATVQPDGAWTYVPDAGWSGTDTFTYVVTDGTTSLTRTVTVTVTPTAADDAVQVPPGAATTVPASQGLLANDAGDLTVTSYTQPDHGTVVVDPSGGYVFTPPDGWSGRTTFTYSARDGAGHTVTRTATVTVSPVGADDGYRAPNDGGTTVPADRGLLANDDGALTVVRHTQPAQGSVVVSPDGSFTYTPPRGWTGTTTFTYTASDGVSELTRTVTLTVERAAGAHLAHTGARADVGLVLAVTLLTVGAGLVALRRRGPA